MSGLQGEGHSTGEWKDQEALFLKCSVWREQAEHVAESLGKGMQVIVQGRLRQRSYETKAGEKRTAVELHVDVVGPALRYATAKVQKKTTRSGSGGGHGELQPAGTGDMWNTNASDDGDPPF